MHNTEDDENNRSENGQHEHNNNHGDHHNHSMQHEPEKSTWKDYLAFGLVIAGIFVVSMAVNSFWQNNSPGFMPIFMGVFFLVFATFKLLDLKGFAHSFMGYDIIAKRWNTYAFIYPFIELLLALGYFAGISAVNWFTIIFMTIGTIGVGKELLRKSNIKCACLGTFIKLPLTKISLTEYLVMGLMALSLLINN